MHFQYQHLNFKHLVSSLFKIQLYQNLYQVKKLTRQVDNQRFGFTARIITAKRSDVYGELMAFIMKQRSGKENFTIIPPEIEDARGNVSGTVLVNGVHAVGDTTIILMA